MQAIHGLGYLRSDAHLLCELGHLMLEIEVTERSTMLVARRWQLVQVFCGCIFHSCQAQFGRKATHTDGEVIWWAGRSPQ